MVLHCWVVHRKVVLMPRRRQGPGAPTGGSGIKNQHKQFNDLGCTSSGRHDQGVILGPGWNPELVPLKSCLKVNVLDTSSGMAEVATQTEVISKPRTRQRRLRRQQIAAQQRL